MNGAVSKHQFIVRRQRGELVGMRPEGKSGQFGDFGGSAQCKLRVGVESGADGGAADGQVVKAIERRLESAYVAGQQTGPTGHLLSDRERRGVLQMRAPNLDHVS